DVLGEVQSKVPSDRILAWREEATHECLVHDRDVLRQLVVTVSEVAASPQFDAQFLEVARADAIPRRADVCPRCRWGLPGDAHAFAPIAGERVVERETGASHARNASKPRFHVAVERG